MEHTSIFETWYKNDSGEPKHMAIFRAKQDIYTLSQSISDKLLTLLENAKGTEINFKISKDMPLDAVIKLCLEQIRDTLCDECKFNVIITDDLAYVDERIIDMKATINRRCRYQILKGERMETELEIKLQKEDFEKLFMAISKGYMAAKAEADRQRAMGKHDYNIFTLFHGFSDEVNLHSNFIASLLDPNGDHYKGDLFLKLFLEMCGIDDFSIDTSRATVFKEFKHIDIYISDGKKHIILENKVYAKDQPTQIARYIETIQNKGAEECDRVKDEDIYVLYLHPDGELPKENSLGGYKLSQDKTKLVKGSSIIKFKVIRYDKEILEWIDKCKNEVSNITDLNVFLSQYKDVIEMIYNRYKRIDEMETANLVEIFKENYTAVSEIANNYQEMRKKIIYSFFSNAAKILRGDSEIKSVYDIKTEENQDYRPIIITKKNPKDGEIWEKFYFTVEFQKSPYSMPYVGFRRKEDKNTNAKNYKKPCEDQLKKQTEYFLAVDELYKDVNIDICKKIIEEEFKPETFAKMTNAILIKLKEQKLEMQTNQN